MSLAVDFGTSNTVLAHWHRDQAQVLHLADYGLEGVVPSLLHYHEEGRRWLGHQVKSRNLLHHPHTFRWLKRYLLHRSPIKRRIGGRTISVTQAAGDFLETVLRSGLGELGAASGEVAFTVPVESFEFYENWLAEVAEQADCSRLRLLDEATAAALGYQVNAQPGHVYLIFDFGGGTLDVSVVRVEENGCRVLGKAGEELGGATLDSWIYEAVLAHHRLTPDHPLVLSLSAALLAECEALKERLSLAEKGELSLVDPATGKALGFSLDRAGFERLVEEKDGFAAIDRTIRRALAASRERGYDEDQVVAVFMVGGSSLIPAVQSQVKRIFGASRVRLENPMQAVALGAATWLGGGELFDHIQHEYAIRWVDPASGREHFQTLVKPGTSYPTDGPVARMVVKANYEGQRQLGLAVFEVSRSRPRQATELVFDGDGGARLTQVEAGEAERRSRFWMNEEAPTFLLAGPPAAYGQRRFQVEFAIDERKRLVVSALDLVTNLWVLDRYPVVKLA